MRFLPWVRQPSTKSFMVRERIFHLSAGPVYFFIEKAASAAQAHVSEIYIEQRKRKTAETEEEEEGNPCG